MTEITAALVKLAYFNIPVDVQELLVHGDPMRGIPPGALTAALQAAEAQPVDGWVMVPVEPTLDMCRADPGTATTNRDKWNAAMYRAMLAVRPVVPTPSHSLAEARRLALEEAASAVCSGCNKGVPVNEFNCHETEAGSTWPCHAVEIRALSIAREGE
jgi:hypothetical protein